MEAELLILNLIQRRLATIGLMVDASRKVQETVGVVSLPVDGGLQVGCLDTC